MEAGRSSATYPKFSENSGATSVAEHCLGAAELQEEWWRYRKCLSCVLRSRMYQHSAAKSPSDARVLPPALSQGSRLGGARR